MMAKDLEYLPIVLQDLPYGDWFLLKLLTHNFKEIRFGQLCKYIRNEMKGMPDGIKLKEVKTEKITTVGVAIHCCNHCKCKRKLPIIPETEC